MQPVIAVTADVREMAPYLWHATPSTYIDAAVNVAGALPLIVPNLESRLDVDILLDRVDGVLVTGSRSNVHPSNYSQEPNDDHEPFDRARDGTTLPLIRRAIERGIPLLAICRGIQELNVALGGSITAQFQKNRNIENHDYPYEGTSDERFAIAHSVKVREGSCLSEILNSDMENSGVAVNSLHTQALDKLGKNVVVEATAMDGTIEAVTVQDAPGFVVGVQWHPEYWAETDTPSNKILKAFGEAAQIYGQSRTSHRIAAE